MCKLCGSTQTAGSNKMATEPHVALVEPHNV